MAATFSSALLQSSVSSATAVRSKPKLPSFQVRASAAGRRQLVFTLTAAATIPGVRPSGAAEIGLFGIRKGLKKAEEKAEEIIKEGFEAADKGIETAEKVVETAEKVVETAEKGVEKAEEGVAAAVRFGGLEQAGVVVGAELVGILVGSAVVNGILGPEAQKSSS